MVLTGKGNSWTDHVRAFATKNNLSYMCAMSDPQCSATYKGAKPKRAVKAVRSKPLTKKEKRENITMAMEDKPAPARKEALGDIFESVTPIEGFTSPTVRAILKNKGALNRALEKKLADQQGMLAEDVNRALPDTKGKATKAGRPKKYADPEEARKAKIANTIRRAKERVGEKKDAKMVARIDRAKNEYNRFAETMEANIHSDGKGKRTENESVIERVDKMKKKYPSLKVSDWYRPLVIKPDATEKIQTVKLPAELTSLSGGASDGALADIGKAISAYGKTDTGKKILGQVKNFGKQKLIDGMKNLGQISSALENQINPMGFGRKTGGMLGWVKSIIGRHPQLTREQIEQAERFADDLMADPRGITFDGASVVPLDVRKELAQEFYNRSTMSREDKDAIGTAGDTFADEIRRQYEAQQKKKRGKGRMTGGFGFGDFVSGLNKLNPVMWGIQNHPEVGTKLGQVTNDNLLPAVVAIGKPVFDAVAVSVATELTGDPALGKIAGEEFWDEYGKPYDPRSRQDNEALKKISEKVGNIAGKESAKRGKEAFKKEDEKKEGKGRRKKAGGPSQSRVGMAPFERDPDLSDTDSDNSELDSDELVAKRNKLMNDIQSVRNSMTELFNVFLEHSNMPQEDYINHLIRLNNNRSRLDSKLERINRLLQQTGGATTLQKGLSAELRSYTQPPLQHDLNQIIHSNDAPFTKYGQTPNAYRDYTNEFDPQAQRQIDRAIAVLVRQGVIPAPPAPKLSVSAPAFVPSGKGRFGSYPSKYTPTFLPKGGAFRPYTGEGPPIFTADYRGPEVQAERRRATAEYDRRMNGGLTRYHTGDDDFAGIDWHAIGKALTERPLGNLTGGAYPSENTSPERMFYILKQVVNAWNKTHSPQVVENVFTAYIPRIEDHDPMFRNPVTAYLLNEIYSFNENIDTLAPNSNNPINFHIPNTLQNYLKWTDTRRLDIRHFDGNLPDLMEMARDFGFFNEKFTDERFFDNIPDYPIHPRGPDNVYDDEEGDPDLTGILPNVNVIGDDIPDQAGVLPNVNVIPH
jgi:hypothetical protein